MKPARRAYTEEDFQEALDLVEACWQRGPGASIEVVDANGLTKTAQVITTALRLVLLSIAEEEGGGE